MEHTGLKIQRQKRTALKNEKGFIVINRKIGLRHYGTGFATRDFVETVCLKTAWDIEIDFVIGHSLGGAAAFFDGDSDGIILCPHVNELRTFGAPEDYEGQVSRFETLMQLRLESVFAHLRNGKTLGFGLLYFNDDRTLDVIEPG